MKRIENKVAVVTGAAQGIGRAIAHTFAQHGGRLVLFDLNVEALEALAQELRKRYVCEVLTRQLDIADQRSVQIAIDDAVEQFTCIDILINNAGINVFADPLSISSEQWQKCFAVDLDGAWHCIKAALPSMLQQSYGHIVNIASVHGHKIIRGSFPYPVAKHGLIGLTRSIAIEYADQGIRANSISPGLIDTPLAQDYFESQKDPEAARQKEKSLLPCQRFGTVDEVANTALFLASDEARFINATDILIDGGRSQVYCD